MVAKECIAKKMLHKIHEFSVYLEKILRRFVAMAFVCYSDVIFVVNHGRPDLPYRGGRRIGRATASARLPKLRES